MKYILLILLSLCSISVSAQHELAAPNCELRTKPTAGIDAYCTVCGEKQQKERAAKQKAEEQKLATMKAAQETKTRELAAETARRKQALANKQSPKEGMTLVAPTRTATAAVKTAPVKEVSYSAEDKELLALVAKGKLQTGILDKKIIFWNMVDGQRVTYRTIAFEPEADKSYTISPMQPEGYAIAYIRQKNERDYYDNYAQDLVNIKGAFLIGDPSVKQIFPCSEKWVLLCMQTRSGMIDNSSNVETDKLEMYNLQTKERIPFPADAMSSHALKIGWYANSSVSGRPMTVNCTSKLWDYKIVKASNLINLTAIWDLGKMNAEGLHFCSKKPMPAEIRSNIGNNNMLFLILVSNGSTYADFAFYGFDPGAGKLSLIDRRTAQYTSLLSDWFAEICK